MKYKNLIIFLALSMILTSCGPLATAVATSAPTTSTPKPTNTPLPLPPTATPTLDKTAPQRIEFKSADGTNLVGYYYPAVVENAPIVVLMHWALGTQ